MQNTIIESYQPLMDAIILQAVTDYRNALIGRGYGRKSAEAVVIECEKFFRSEYYSLLTKISGEYLIEKLRQEVEEKQNEQI